MKETNLKAAVIGVGNIGYHHCRILKGMKGVKLCGLADIDAERRNLVSKEFETTGYADYRRLIERERPDFVTIAVPVRQHFPVASECLKQGIHVLLEKPASDRIEEIEKLISLSETSNCLFTVGHVERFNPAVQALKELIDKDELGTITNLVARRVGGYPPKLTNIGVFVDLAVHDIDVFRYLIGANPDKIEVQRLNVHSNSVEDAATAFLQYPSASGFIQVNWITPVKIRQLSVTGTRGHAELNYIEQTLSIYEHNVNPEDFSEKDFVEFLGKYGKPMSRSVKVERAEPLSRELEHFVLAVRGGTELLVKPVEVLETMKIVLSV
ncbi:MAG TPA: Gfo/Idh/MocA family oxidoreductase [Balneolales bacterium]|nr:Gfo/Idh/MocA family oxidoreductase [Balneolales bacterium]